MQTKTLFWNWQERSDKWHKKRPQTYLFDRFAVVPSLFCSGFRLHVLYIPRSQVVFVGYFLYLLQKLDIFYYRFQYFVDYFLVIVVKKRFVLF